MNSSKRFNKDIVLTYHAIEQMQERNVDSDVLYDLIESGTVLHKDTEHLWIYKAFEGRADNMLCAAIIERSKLIVKTVMINWELDNEH